MMMRPRGSRLKAEACDEDRAIPSIPTNSTAPISVKVSPFASRICVGYLLSAAFYFYVRVVYTLDTGDYGWYSKLILAMELLGFSTLLPYAFMITRAVHSNKTPGLPKGELGESAPTHPWFTVHVLIPCYKEPIDVIAKTIEAALSARVPPNVIKQVYVCDDGKRAVTLAFCQTKRNPVLFYVSGRSRKPGEKNGKSANLNNCLQNMIFSTFKNGNGTIDQEVAKDIPLSDVIVVLDCGMVCKPNFFLKILEVMADDSLALCLTPQAFSNIDPYIDLFNTINVKLWQYMLPGCVAGGYVACTGTNFCIRARALAHVGWFPEYTITEDYALGMELAVAGFKGTYLNEYLAVGEAPDEIRNVMQQCSRWTKGHMQVFFSKRCPLLNWRLSCINRILYTNGTWAYFVTVITTPIFLSVPLICLVFGIHPVAVTKEFALAAVIYFSFTFMIQWYFRDPKHLVSLWFSNISNHILCGTYFKVLLGALMSIFGGNGTRGFKVWRKYPEKKSYLVRALEAMAQKTRSMVHEIEDNTINIIFLFLSFSISLTTIFLGIHQAIVSNVFDVHTTLPILWAAQNIIPPFLFLWCGFTKGPSFRSACTFAHVSGVLCGLGALVSLWFV